MPMTGLMLGRNEKMKTVAAILATLIAFPAFADGMASNTARVVGVDPKIETRYETQDVQVCEQYQVPVYGNVIVQGSQGDVLAGAIVGGAIGNQFGGGSGKDAMTVLGAILGANQASQPRVRNGVTGYTWETRCHYEQQMTPVNIQTGFIVTYEQYGSYYQTFMNVQPRVGSFIEIN